MSENVAVSEDDDRPVIELTIYEMRQAGALGLERQLESVATKRTPHHPESRPLECWSYHVVGAMAELAVAKYLNACWAGRVNDFAVPDIKVGDIGIEVRYSPGRSDIKVRETDSDHTVVIGVTGIPPKFRLLGCIRAKTAREQVEKSAPAPGKSEYFVPLRLCTPVPKFRDWLVERAAKPITAARMGRLAKENVERQQRELAERQSVAKSA